MTKIHLYCSNIEDSGLKRLTEGVYAQNIVSATFGSDWMNNSVLETIATNFSNLSYLDVSECEISDEGLLEAIPKLK